MMENTLNHVQPEKSQSNKLVYTVKEIAEMLDMPIRSAYAFCASTKEFKIKKMGRNIRINKESFDQWFAE